MLELPGNVICERTAFDWVTALVPILCKNLSSQSMGDNATDTNVLTWVELLRGYPGNF